jgi:hypothetical protein
MLDLIRANVVPWTSRSCIAVHIHCDTCIHARAYRRRVKIDVVIAAIGIYKGRGV